VRQIESPWEQSFPKMEQTTTYEPVIDAEVPDTLLEYAKPEVAAGAVAVRDRAANTSSRSAGQKVRVALALDPSNSKTVRKLAATLVTNDADLERQLAELRDDLAAGGTGLTVIIDSFRNVPWNDVVAVVKLCDRLDVGVEFEFHDP
jgi:hypothetical protein